MTHARHAAALAFLASLLILGLKTWAYLGTGSAAILSDALESIINVVAAAVAMGVMRAVAAPADEDHPYGHGKLEYFSSAFEGGLIGLAGIAIAFEGVRAFFDGRAPRELDFGLLVSSSAAGLNLALGFYLLHVGKKNKSEALVASGSHVLSDVWSTAGAIVGLLLVKITGLVVFDSIAAVLIAIQLSYSGLKIVRRSVGGLIDEMEPQALDDLAFAFEKNRVPAVIDIHLLKVIRSGRFHHIDCHLVVPEYWSISEGHELMENFERDVVQTYPFDGEIAFHLDPCFREYCSICQVEKCPVRERPFQKHRKFTRETLILGPQKDGVHV